MPNFTINNTPHQIDCIIFDKDGTLIDLHILWGAMVERWIKAIFTRMENRPKLLAALYQTIGYDAYNHIVIPDGALAVTTLPKLATLVAVVLHQHGESWHDADEIAESVLFDAASALPTAEMIRPIYAPATLQTLHNAGIQLAILTSDDRAPTEETVRLLQIEHLFSAIGCADDPIPNKPNPAGIHRISSLLNIDPANMIMVGDSNGDMLTGRSAGVASTVGVGSVNRFGANADIVVPSVDHLVTMLQ